MHMIFDSCIHVKHNITTKRFGRARIDVQNFLLLCCLHTPLIDHERVWMNVSILVTTHTNRGTYAVPKPCQLFVVFLSDKYYSIRFNRVSGQELYRLPSGSLCYTFTSFAIQWYILQVSLVQTVQSKCLRRAFHFNEL